MTDLLDFSHVSQRAKSSISHYLTYGQHRGQKRRVWAKSPCRVGSLSGIYIDTVEGDILCIDRFGEITRSEFEPKLYRSKYAAWYDTEDSPFYNLHAEMLIAYCGCYGVDSADVELLLEYGYTCDEIEEMLSDHDLLHEALRDVKYMCGEELYENCYGGVY